MATRSSLDGAAHAFASTVAVLERGKVELLRAIPGARRPGVPLAEALLAFRESLDEAAASMAAWRLPELAHPWETCRRALDAAAGLEERLRLSAPTLSHEALLATLGDLIAPLEAFAEADELVRDRTGRRG